MQDEPNGIDPDDEPILSPTGARRPEPASSPAGIDVEPEESDGSEHPAEGRLAGYQRWHLLVVLGVVISLIGVFTVSSVFEGPPPTLPPQPDNRSGEDFTVIDELPSLPTVTSTTQPPPTAQGASSRGVDARSLPSSQRPLAGDCASPNLIYPPAGDFASVVAAAEPGTCFVLQPGEYGFHNVVPKDHMTIIGTSRDEVVVWGSGETENAFHGTAVGVNIGRMRLIGFKGTGGQKAQEQAAIRGTSALWESKRGALARDWLIEDIEASDNFASGVFLGDDFTVRGSTFANNGVTGLGGNNTVGGLVEGNIVTGNGFQGAGGYLANGGGMKFTSAISPEDPLIIHRNEIHGNEGIGVWCDIGCNGFEVLDNYIHDQRSQGVMFELSSNAVIRGNLLVNANTWTDFGRDFNAGAITVGESSNVLVENNYIDGAKAGVVVRQTRRPVLPQEEFLYSYEYVVWESGQVHVRNNVMVNTGAAGISNGATGHGLITDPGSIRFEANTYANAGSMAFWWDGGNRYSFADWQSSGRDLGGGATAPARPAWTALAS